MTQESLLEGKRILLVDDEADILEMLEEELDMCELATASSFHEANDLLESQNFDMAILDIMGVRGYKLLEIANEKEVISIMLTAHALSPENVDRSRREGAASYVPKQKICDICAVLADILEAEEKGVSFWGRWHDRFDSYFDNIFGPNWNTYGEFWKETYSVKWEEKYFH
jgi:DNA-binding NtrC family response regulator